MKKFLVGGAVRDTMMGREPADKDYVVVGSTPEEMLALGFQQVGADFPVFLHPETHDEYALARVERKVNAGYHGFSVEFGTDVTLEQDLSRRDLTINSMAMDEDGKLYDFFGGEKDLADKVLRHTSMAFVEDPLRVVRLARFFARYDDFAIAAKTVGLARDIVDSGEMDALSPERFWGEMVKVFHQSGTPSRFFKALSSFGVLDKVKFFKDVFGDTGFDWDFVLKAIYNAKDRLVHSTDQLMVFVALMASESAAQKSTVIPTEVKRLTNNVRAFRKMEFTPQGVLQMLKTTRAFGQSGDFDDFIIALRVAEASGEKFPCSRITMRSAFLIATAVTSDAFLHLQGAEIGKAMDQERLKRLTEMFNV